MLKLQSIRRARGRGVRFVAGAAAIALATAGLSLAGSLSAQAGGLDSANSNASIVASLDTTSPTVGDKVTASAVVTMVGAQQCETVPTVSYEDTQSNSGTLTGTWDATSHSYSYSYQSAALTSGEHFSSTFTATGDCITPDAGDIGITSEEAVAVDPINTDPVDPDPITLEWPTPSIDPMYDGVAFDQTFTAPSDGDWDWTTGGTGVEDGSLPNGISWERVNENVPGTPVGIRLYGTPLGTGGFGFVLTATDSNENSATTGLIDLEVGDAPAPDPTSTTDASKLCDGVPTDDLDDYGDASDSFDVETNSAIFDDVCTTDPSVDDAGTANENHDDAFDDFGYISFDQGEDHDRYYVTADTQSTTDIDNGKQLVLTDNDIYLAPEDETVDVTITRTIQGSFMRWSVEVRDSETHDLVNVPFDFDGDLGSDSDTSWTGSGDWRVSNDGGDGDPIIAHSVSADNYSWDTEDGNDHPAVHVTTGGELTYTVAILDYACINSDVIAQAGTVAQAMTADFGTDLDPLTTSGCPVWTPELNTLQVGVPFDQTLTLPTDGWDWTEGGDIGVWDDLPDGLSYEVLGSGEAGTAPSLHIYGTPTESGDFTVAVGAEDEFNHEVDTDLAFHILPAIAPVWPAPTIDGLQVGVNYDQTFTPPLAGWDWSEGGLTTLTGDLPAGLSWEAVNTGVAGTAPGIRIFGTPTTEGSTTFQLHATDGIDTESTGDIIATVAAAVAPLAPTMDATLTLGISIGDFVGGAPATATGEGLLVGADYTVTVHSTTTVLASGTVPAEGAITRTVSLPTGLEKGWHALSFSSTYYTGTTFTKTLYFFVNADGTLGAVTTTEPADTALAYTGTDPSGALAGAAGLLLLGLLFVSIRRVRIRRRAS